MSGIKRLYDEFLGEDPNYFTPTQERLIEHTVRDFSKMSNAELVDALKSMGGIYKFEDYLSETDPTDQDVDTVIASFLLGYMPQKQIAETRKYLLDVVCQWELYRYDLALDDFNSSLWGAK